MVGQLARSGYAYGSHQYHTVVLDHIWHCNDKMPFNFALQNP